MFQIIRMHGGANVCDNPGSASYRKAGSLSTCWAAHSRIVICLLLCLLSPSLWAQGSGRFYGVVTDLGGSAVAGAKVELQNTGTGIDRDTVTDGGGNYEFIAVPVDSG